MKTKLLFTRVLSALAVVMIIGLFLDTNAQTEKKITKKELPPAVLAAFEKAYPKAVIKGFSKEEENDKIIYEVESKDGEIARDLLYLADGQVIEIEESCTLPEVVQKAIDQNYPKGKIEKAEKLTRGTIIEYEVIVKVGEQRSEVVLDPTGKVLKAQKIAEEEEKEKTEKESEEKDEN